MSDVDPESTESPPIDLRDARIAELETKLAETEGRLRAVSKAYADQKSEIGAFRERADLQLRTAIARKEGEVARIFFEPVQNLHRAVTTHTTDVEVLLTGVRMVLDQCTAGLEKLGLRPVPGVGAAFDPTLHEAIGIAPVEDPDQDGRVVTVYVEGYVVGTHVLQTAKVAVGKYGRPVPEA